MGPGRKLYRTGLLKMKKEKILKPIVTLKSVITLSKNVFLRKTLLLIILLMFLSEAGAEENISDVIAVINPETIMVNVPFTITFIVDHPAPDEVLVIVPPFHRSISIDRIVRYPSSFFREESGRSAAQVRTFIEYRLIPGMAGRIYFDSFTIVTPAGQTRTNPFEIIIQSPTTEQRVPTEQLFWERPPQQITAGERVTLTLVIQNTSEAGRISIPPPAFFMPEVPQNVILASQSLTAQERARGIVLKLLLIPLSPLNFSLPARMLEHENTRFEIPVLNIRVTE